MSLKEENLYSQDFKKNSQKFEFEYQNNKLVFEIDHVANKSDKSVICRFGNTTILSVLTVKKLHKHSSFFPLNISLEEKFYAIGKIPGSFGKREGKPSYDAITGARLIDRSLRPFFPSEKINQEVQINNYILSLDEKHDARLAAI